ncbi:hypothetical protein PybrP1_002132 [[Pythium] brassicae (nom. inval.)]|nr:hypothetical protein PybrP1_002132 [[Pythium] brassicae (nom. inval.)]
MWWLPTRRLSASGGDFHDTFRNRKRSGSAEFLFAEVRNAIDPSSRFTAAWQQLVLACILYELALLVYMAAFDGAGERREFLGLYLCELVFCVDVYVQLNTGYYENGNVLRDTRKSRTKYLRSRGFVLDVLALPPLSLLPVRAHASALVFLEFHKFVRVRRLPQLISDLDNIYARYFVLLKLAKVLGVTLLTSHVVACARFAFGYDTHHDNHWLPRVPEHAISGLHKYLTALFWAFGLLTGLFEGELPHSNAQFAFTIGVALCGFSLFTYLCATFFTLSKCESGDSETAEARVNQFRHVLAFHRVPDKLQEQAVEYLKRYYTQADANDREAARLLCPSIASDIQIELLQDTVARIPVFDGCDTHFVQAVTSLLELISCPARFVLFRTGDHGDAMYVINSGVLYTVVGGVKVRELRKGSFFGEVAVFARLPRSATMMTTTYSTLYRLSRFHVDKLLDGYPRYARRIAQTVDAMLQKANSRDEDQISELANAAAAPAPAKKRKKSILLHVVERTKRSLSAVRPDGSAERPTSSVGSASSSRKIAPLSVGDLEAAKTSGGGGATAAERPGALQTRPASSKVHPAVAAPPPPPRAPLGRMSVFRESKRQLDLFRDSFFRKGSRVGPGDGKPPDAIRGFYDQLAQTAPPPPTTRYWWAALLPKRCTRAESRTRMAWLLCLQLVLCYNWITVPLQLAFPLLDDHIAAIAVLNVATDVLLWLDVYGSLSLSYTLNSETITDPVRSAKRYAGSWGCTLDLLCASPYGLLQPRQFHAAAARLPRLLRLWRLKGHFAEVENYTLMNSRKRLLLFGLALLLLYHIVACLYFSVTHWEGFSHHDDAWIPSDDVAMEQLNATSFVDSSGRVYAAGDPQLAAIGATQYARALYYAANVLAALGRTIEPATDRQYGVALAFMLSGFLITAVVVDEVQKRFTASAFEQKEFFATRTRIRLFLKRQSAPLAIHQRVNSFLDFWWSSHRGAIVQELLEELPSAIKRDIVRSICTPAVESLALLRVQDPFRTLSGDAVPDDVRAQLEAVLLDNLRFVLYGQGEIIYRLGDHASGLYFVLEGRVSVMPDGGYPYVVPLGGFFGTAALHAQADAAAQRAGATLTAGYLEHATAVSGCIVVYLSRAHLLAMESAFPSLPVSLQVLERALQNAKVARTSELASLASLAGGLPSPFLQRQATTARADAAHPVASIWRRVVAYVGPRAASVDPDARFVGLWEAWIFLATTLQSSVVVYHICFGSAAPGAPPAPASAFRRADALTVLLECCFAVDLYLQSRLGFYEYGNKVMDMHLIQAHYFRSAHFAVDVGALVPLFALNWLGAAGGAQREVLNLNKLLRVYKAPRHFRSLAGKYVKLATELRLLKLVYYTFLAAHLFGCVWFDFGANRSGLQTWISAADNADNADNAGSSATATFFGDNAWLPPAQLAAASPSEQYFGSVFWSFGLMSASSTGELPKTVAQCVFSVTTMTSGFFLFAYVVGNFLDVIELSDSEDREFVAKLSSLRHLLAHFPLPADVQDKFKTYFFFKRFHSITQEHVLERVLPPSLLVDIRMFQLQPMIVKVAFLAGMEDAVTRMLVSLFTQTLYVKDEFICRFGEDGSEMFFVFTGVLDILVPVALLPLAGDTAPLVAAAPPPRAVGSGLRDVGALQKVNEITAGSYFGEAALFTHAPRNAFVKAKTSCILYRLSRHSLELVFDRFPAWKKKVLRIVKIQQEQQQLTRQATEIQESDGGGGTSGGTGSGGGGGGGGNTAGGAPGRRRVLRRIHSRMDALNSRAESIEKVLLAHARGDQKKSLASSLLRCNWLPRLRAAVFAPVLARARGVLLVLVAGAEIQSRVYVRWVRLTSLCTVFMAVVVPYRVVYDALERWNGVPVLVRAAESACEVVFWWDVWFQFRVRSNQGAMELYEQEHLQAYKRERLAWDLVAAFPLDHFVAGFVPAGSAFGTARRWLRLNRCAKVRNLVHYRSEIKRRSVSFELDRVKALGLLYLIGVFWTSCAYFAVAMHGGFGAEWQAWLPAQELAAPDPAPALLLRRLFRGLMFGTTAFVKKARTFVPTRTLDYAFSILVSFAGQLVMALMIGELANVFILYTDNEIRFRKNHIAVEHYLARCRVSPALKLRANAFLSSWWSSYAGVDYQTVFADLPRSVRTDGVLCIAEKPLQLFMERVFRPLARGGGHGDAAATALAESVMHAVAQRLRFEGYPRGESVVVEGSVCKAMYFVVRGYLFSKSRSNPAAYQAGRFRMGDYFGDVGLLGHSVSLMTVTSIRASDLFALDSEALLEVLAASPFFQLVLQLAQDVAQRKKAECRLLAGGSGSGGATAELLIARRTSAPVVGMRAPSTLQEHARKQLHGSAGADVPPEAKLTAMLNVHNEREWGSAFRLFVELILPSGTLNDLDGTPKRAETDVAPPMHDEPDADAAFSFRGDGSRATLETTVQGNSTSTDQQAAAELAARTARTRRLSKALEAGGAGRHELLQETNIVLEGHESEEEKEEEGENKRRDAPSQS